MGAVATGGTITRDRQFTVHVFNATDTLVMPDNVSVAAEVLLIAGGGGGSYGGGGAGGYVTGAETLVGSMAVTVGAGGAGGNNVDGSVGGDTVFGTRTAKGGGGGGAVTHNGVAGGSGGGCGGSTSAQTGGVATPAGQGFAGGTNGGITASPYPAGGGGGAGAVGGNGYTLHGGPGGTGLYSDLVKRATLVGYAGGGGGGIAQTSGTVGGTATEGGGAGARSGAGTAGTANTGGGGGGSNGGGSAGGTGGSGLVVVRYPTPANQLAYPNMHFLGVDGNSLMYGHQGAVVHGVNDFSTQLVALLSDRIVPRCPQINGDSTGGNITRFPTWMAPYLDSSYKSRTVVFMEAINQLSATGMPADEILLWETYCNLARAAGVENIIVCTVPAGNDPTRNAAAITRGFASWDALVKAFNVLLMAQYTRFADDVADFGADQYLGNVANCGDGIWFMDQLHLTAAGYGRMALIAAAAYRRVHDRLGASIATQVAAVPAGVRTNLATELGRVDAAVTSRAAPGAKMDLIDAPNATGLAAVASAVSGLATTGLAALKALIDAVGAKTVNLPASPAAVGSAMTLTSAYDAAKAAAAAGAAMTLTSAYDKAKTAAAPGDSMALTSGERGSLWTLFDDHADDGLGALSAAVGLVDDHVSTAAQSAIDASIAANDAKTAADAAKASADLANRVAPDNAGIAAIKAKTDGIGRGTINVVAATHTDGTWGPLVAGDDYNAGTLNELSVTTSIDLSGTPVVTMNMGPIVGVVCTVAAITGGRYKVTVPILTAAQTALLKAKVYLREFESVKSGKKTTFGRCSVKVLADAP